MRCPECLYELTENEKLLCFVHDGHYCPRCWARITQDSFANRPGTASDRSGRKRTDIPETKK